MAVLANRASTTGRVYLFPPLGRFTMRGRGRRPHSILPAIRDSTGAACLSVAY